MIKPSKPERLNRTVIYESRWVNLYRDRVMLPNGHVVEQHHFLDFGPGSVAVVVENEQGQILMEQIARYSTGTTTWELPAGGIDPGEEPLHAAAREVHEETGYETHDHVLVYQYHPLNGISNKLVFVVRCRAGAKTGLLDENEVSAVRWFSRDELAAMIERKEITDGMSLIGLLLP